MVGERNRHPSNQSAGLLQTFWDVLRRPGTVFSAPERYANPYLLTALAWGIGTLLQIGIKSLQGAEPLAVFGGLHPAAATTANVAIAILLGYLLIGLSAILLYIPARLLGGNASLGSTARMVAYSSAIIPLTVIPLLKYLALLYGVYLLVKGVAATHRISTARAFFPVLLIPILGILLFFGSALTAQSFSQNLVEGQIEEGRNLASTDLAVESISCTSNEVTITAENTGGKDLSINDVTLTIQSADGGQVGSSNMPDTTDGSWKRGETGSATWNLDTGRLDSGTYRLIPETDFGYTTSEQCTVGGTSTGENGTQTSDTDSSTVVSGEPEFTIEGLRCLSGTGVEVDGNNTGGRDMRNGTMFGYYVSNGSLAFFDTNSQLEWDAHTFTTKTFTGDAEQIKSGTDYRVELEFEYPANTSDNTYTASEQCTGE